MTKAARTSSDRPPSPAPHPRRLHLRRHSDDSDRIPDSNSSSNSSNNNAYNNNNNNNSSNSNSYANDSTSNSNHTHNISSSSSIATFNLSSKRRKQSRQQYPSSLRASKTSPSAASAFTASPDELRHQRASSPTASPLIPLPDRLQLAPAQPSTNKQVANDSKQRIRALCFGLPSDTRLDTAVAVEVADTTPANSDSSLRGASTAASVPSFNKDAYASSLSNCSMSSRENATDDESEDLSDLDHLDSDSVSSLETVRSPDPPAAIAAVGLNISGVNNADALASASGSSRSSASPSPFPTTFPPREPSSDFLLRAQIKAPATGPQPPASEYYQTQATPPSFQDGANGVSNRRRLVPDSISKYPPKDDAAYPSVDSPRPISSIPRYPSISQRPGINIRSIHACDDEEDDTNEEDRNEESDSEEYDEDADANNTLQSNEEDGKDDVYSLQLDSPVLPPASNYQCSENLTSTTSVGVKVSINPRHSQNSSYRRSEASSSSQLLEEDEGNPCLLPPNLKSNEGETASSLADDDRLKQKDVEEKVRKQALQDLQDIETELKLFKERFFQEKSREIDLEVMTVRDGTHEKIATLTADIEMRKVVFDKYALQRLQIAEERYGEEFQAAVEIANLEFVVGESVVNIDIASPYHASDRDRGISHKRRKSRRSDWAEWKILMNDDDYFDDFAIVARNTATMAKSPSMPMKVEGGDGAVDARPATDALSWSACFGEAVTLQQPISAAFGKGTKRRQFFPSSTI
ncbi:hypothetical protein HDU82_008538 [Entophlyctis luteolus]|nr:hypothetical protein HDU82_008538 [Entophlyctis luteolus]